jgi:hypothetical protein
MSTLGPGIFSWALQEKKDMDSCNDQELSPLLGKQDYERLLLLRHGLVPLKDVELEESNTAPLPVDLDDIVFVFSRTLSILSIYIPPDRRRRPGIDPHFSSLCQFLTGVIHLGQQNTGQTDLLALKTFNMHLSALGPGFLAHCPKVNSTTLQDTTFDYQLREVIRQRCFPAWLRRAKVLVLSGWPVLTLHPITLYATRRLDDLRLSTAVRLGEQCFISYFTLSRRQLRGLISGCWRSVCCWRC